MSERIEPWDAYSSKKKDWDNVVEEEKSKWVYCVKYVNYVCLYTQKESQFLSNSHHALGRNNPSVGIKQKGNSTWHRIMKTAFGVINIVAVNEDNFVVISCFDYQFTEHNAKVENDTIYHRSTYLYSSMANVNYSL